MTNKKWVNTKSLLFILSDIGVYIFVSAAMYVLTKLAPQSFLVNEFNTMRIVLAACLTFMSRTVFGIYNVEWDKTLTEPIARLLVADAVGCFIYIALGAYNYVYYLGFGYSLLLGLVIALATIATRLVYQKIDAHKKRETSKKVQFSPPDITDAEINEVVDALKSGWITTGPRTKQFERNIQSYLGVNRAVCLNSQTACAEMALRLLGIGPGDEVITCAYTYTASASVIEHVGAKIVLVDCEKDSFEINYEEVEKAINERTKAIIPIDIGGIPCDYERLYEIVERKKDLFKPGDNDIQKAIGRVIICADTAHAFGSSYKGQMVGGIADFSSSSFHAVKNLTTAEGGCLTWKPVPGIDDEDIYHRLQLFSLHGQSKDALAKTKLGAWEYDIVGTWYKCNMTDVVASIGLKQLERYPGLLAKRRKINEMYDAALAPLGLDLMKHYTNEYTSSGHLYLVRVPGITVEQRNEIITKMAERGVTCNVHYKPLPMHTAYMNLGFDIKDYPNAYERYHNLISLPNHTLLKDTDVKFVIDNFKEVLQEYI